MSLSIGIVGLPNVGKSTLFNALLKKTVADVSNYPFCTIEPNVGIVEVPDERLDKLQQILKVPNKIPAVIKFVDIAGLVKEAHKGEGLGNQFLAHIRECDALIIVIRFFEDEKITHVEGKVDPQRDVEIIQTELIFKDLETVSKRLESLAREIKSGNKEAKETQKILQKIKTALNENKPASSQTQFLSLEQKNKIKELQLLTDKPVLYVANIGESDLNKTIDYRLSTIDYIPICIKLEAELASFSEEEKQEYLQSYNLKETALDKLIKESYKLLDLITFYTFNRNEVRAWSIKKGTKAPQAAGTIHTDFEKNFIAAEVISYKELLKTGSYQIAKEKGLIRIEGKDYQIQDGDIVYVKHG